MCLIAGDRGRNVCLGTNVTWHMVDLQVCLVDKRWVAMCFVVQGHDI